MAMTMAERKQKALAERQERIKKTQPELYAKIKAQGFEIGASLADMSDAKIRSKNKLNK